MKPIVSAETSERVHLAERSKRGAETRRPHLRLIALICYCAALLIGFAPVLFDLFKYALNSELHSHIILVPFISGYLIGIQRAQLPTVYRSCVTAGGLAAFFGLVLIAIVKLPAIAFTILSRNDQFAVLTVALVSLLVAGGFFFLGRSLMAAVAFPISFLVFMVPLPDAMAESLERGSQLASAEAANALFILFGVPFLRDGLVYRLPNIAIEVAHECSGIRSSWVLFMTSVLGAHMFLRTSWRRALVALAVIPLGILRNGIRILVIAVLCVEIGPEMIDSFLHRRGGPLFFALSLVPLFGLLWWLRTIEGRTTQETRAAAANKRPE